jgi:hypothetical protein
MFFSLVFQQVFARNSVFIYFCFISVFVRFLTSFRGLVDMEFPQRMGVDIENPREASAWVGPLLLGTAPHSSMPIPAEGLTLVDCQLPQVVPPGVMRLHATTVEWSWFRIHVGDFLANRA